MARFRLTQVYSVFNSGFVSLHPEGSLLQSPVITRPSPLGYRRQGHHSFLPPAESQHSVRVLLLSTPVRQSTASRSPAFMTPRIFFYSALVVAALASNSGVITATQEVVQDKLSTSTVSAVTNRQLIQEAAKRFLRRDKSVEDTLDDSVEDTLDDSVEDTLDDDTPEERSRTFDFRNFKNTLNKGREEDLSAYAKTVKKVATTSTQDAKFAKLNGMDVDRALKLGKIKEKHVDAYKAYLALH
ncbi:unnamed protein product [Phytophthora fragariaefolia]|uniref:Unnamed protein product n=1 Tax=Phytophthora fragariaefolia TaxID=1490495 RepID=A0A9W6XTF9_9STRA|nr:unnamed protein product [Phytophthora fragariaefolia]